MPVTEGPDGTEAGAFKSSGASACCLVLRIRSGAPAEQTAQAGWRAGIENQHSATCSKHSTAFAEHALASVAGQHREPSSRGVHDNQIKGRIVERQRVEIPDDVHVSQPADFGQCGAGGPRRRFVCDDDDRLTGESGFGRDRADDFRVVYTHLQRTFAESHAAHRDRQRLGANARLPQEHAHFRMI